MRSMFKNCEEFNDDLSNWNTSELRNIGSMFEGCKKFEGKGLENWNTSKLVIMSATFFLCKKFTGKCLENWDVSRVRDLDDTFSNCENLNCDLSKWDTSNVENMFRTFCRCKKFTAKGLEKWNISKVTDYREMLYGCDNATIPSWYKESWYYRTYNK